MYFSWAFLASLVVQLVENLPAVWETWVRAPDWKDPLEKDMATHSSTLAWGIPWTEEQDRLQSMGRKELETTLQLSFSLSCIFLGILNECEIN